MCPINLSDRIIFEIKERNPQYLFQDDLLELSNKYSIDTDENGFCLNIYDANFKEITTFFTQMLGKPKDETVNKDGEKHWIFSNRKFGIHALRIPVNLST